MYIITYVTNYHEFETLTFNSMVEAHLAYIKLLQRADIAGVTLPTANERRKAA